ncbi:FdhF/YdeP family oxidoreductase [Rhizosaccharibacter radicis]|uniref:FdhF/YdeP family oxidoreductase n=1 Tax=Rhizosaccharibacter radicis TaxID=2782605 RepID=A0ABT1VVN9_9PROT|nr:FdhF/YdeP family oxidoreductase [Acetobacteraceae bacterium KSS12]
MSRTPSFEPYEGPAGGWGSARSLGNILRREGVPASGTLVLGRQNKVDGFQCVSCAWVKPAKPLPFEFCENGAKATAWEITSHRCEPAFFAKHTVSELLGWDDYHLEQVGRLTHPMRYDAASDKYVPVSWGKAVREIGQTLRALPDRRNVVFYSSGRTSNEASYLYGLFARLYGNNNLPDSSNMCHETTSVALPPAIGVPVGTVALDDFAKTDCILFFGQNPGSNSPRMLHPMQEAAERGVPIIAYNPLRERGLERFTNPQSPTEMLTHHETKLASQYHQVKAGGDLAALTGICLAVLEMEDHAKQARLPPVLDHDFIDTHTHGFGDFLGWLRTQGWAELERRSGLSRSAMTATAEVYARSKATIGIYGMGLTQHRAGVETVQMLVNLLLMRGNIGRDGAGICPVRGHSNVQGQRTVGITEKPELVPMDRLAKQYGFEPPRETGLNTVEACEKILAREVPAFIMLGGNFVRAIPDRGQMEPAWREIGLTVNIATKLNRSQLVPGRISYILPVLGRIEQDVQNGPQSTSMEDSTGCIHGSRGVRKPASPHLISETRLVCEIAEATLESNPLTPWKDWASDYRLIRKSIGETYPEIFFDYDQRMWEPGGFQRPLPARHREWKTENGKANFITPKGLAEDKDMPEPDEDALRLITLRSNDQFNTTVYGYTDRFRGIRGTRDVVLMNRSDIARLGLSEGDRIGLRTASKRDDVRRELGGLTVVPYDIPAGCIGAYYPEANVLLPIWHYAEGSKTPAAKSVPVHVYRGPAAA